MIYKSDRDTIIIFFLLAQILMLTLLFTFFESSFFFSLHVYVAVQKQWCRKAGVVTNFFLTFFFTFQFLIYIANIFLNNFKTLVFVSFSDNRIFLKHCEHSKSY